MAPRLGAELLASERRRLLVAQVLALTPRPVLEQIGARLDALGPPLALDDLARPRKFARFFGPAKHDGHGAQRVAPAQELVGHRAEDREPHAVDAAVRDPLAD